MILTLRTLGHRANAADVADVVNRIIAERCDNYTSGSCYDHDRDPDAPYYAQRTCYSCQMKQALGLDPSRRFK